jgi:hypothetical protein
MTPPRRAAGTAAVAALTALLGVAGLAGCSSTSPPAPSGGQTASMPASTPTPAAGGGCRVTEQTGVLRSNTLTHMTATFDGLRDRITFQLGEIAPDPTGSSGRLRAVAPPFAQGASGLPIEVDGTHFVELHLDGMLIADETGNAVYRGETSVKPGLLAVRQIEMTEAFEGVYNFVIGYVGDGCVGLEDDPAARTLTLTIGH